MDLEQVNKLAKEGESDTIEFKTTTAELSKACQTLCGFLNHKGGTVLIGVKGNGQLIGIEVSDKTKQEIANEIRKFEPAPVPIEVKYLPFKEAKFIIVMKVPTGHHIPYTYDGRPYQRIESTTSKMLQEPFEQLIVERGRLNHSWETLSTELYTLENLDQQEILTTIKQGIEANRIPPEALNEILPETLSRLKLLDNGKLTNAAVVLFAKEVLPHYSQCLIKLARFRGTTNLAEFIDNKQCYGHAFKILSEADDFIRRHLSIASFYQSDSFQRIDKPTLPVLAVREALINAICHRDYTPGSSSISVAIYDDRLEIWNSGPLSKRLKLKDLKQKHSSYPRNKLIADIFYHRGFIEKWGFGTLRMVELCKEYEIPEPQFEEYSSGFSVQFKFQEPLTTVIKPRDKETTHFLSRRQEEIVHLLQRSYGLKASEIQEKLSYPAAARTLRDDLLRLKKLGIINYRGGSRSAVWFLIEE